MKKILLNESEKKAIISEREQAIIKSFAKTFNTIKRVDENELTEERPISARYGDDPSPEQSAGIDKFVKDFLDKKDKEKKGEIKPNDTKISGNQLGENGIDPHGADSRGVESGINPYQEQPDMDMDIAYITTGMYGTLVKMLNNGEEDYIGSEEVANVLGGNFKKAFLKAQVNNSEAGFGGDVDFDAYTNYVGLSSSKIGMLYAEKIGVPFKD